MMKSIKLTLNNKKLLPGLILLLIGTLYLSFFAFSNNIWFDESFSAALILDHNMNEIIELAQNDMHPPTYYLIAKVFTIIFGSNLTVLKLVSVLPFIGMMLLGLFPIRRILGDRVGYLMMIFAISMPHVLKFSTEIRNYSMAMFAVLGAVVYAIDLLKNGNEVNIKSSIAFGFFSLFSIYLHYYALMMVFFIHMMILMSVFKNKKYKLLKGILVIELVLCIAYLPWLNVLLTQVNAVKGGFWIPPITLTSLVQLIAVQFYSGDQYFSIIAVICFTNTIVVLALFVFGLVKYFKHIKNKDKDQGDWHTLMMIIGIPYILTFLLFLAISVTMRPILLWRYMIILVPTLWLLLAFFSKEIKKPQLFRGLLVYFLFMIVFNFVRTVPKEYNSDYSELMSFYDQQVDEQDVFIHTDQASLGVFTCLYDNEQYVQEEVMHPFYYIFETNLFADVRELNRDENNVWLVLMDGRDIPEYYIENCAVEYVKTVKLVDTYNIYQVKVKL